MRIEHGTDTRVDSILFGSLLAVLLVTPAADKLLQCLDNISVFSFGVALVLASIVVRNPWFKNIPIHIPECRVVLSSASADLSVWYPAFQMASKSC